MSATSSQASRPSFLMVRYDFLEEALPLLSGNAFKVAVVLYREITRWTEKGPQPTAISTTYLQQETGLSRPTVLKAIKEILKAGLIELLETVSRFGTRIYFLAKRFLGKGEEAEGGKEPLPETGQTSLLVQYQLPETGKETLPIVVKEFNQYQSNPFTSSGKEPLPDATPQPAPEAAPRVAKDILKDSIKDTLKESEPVEEEKEKAEEEYEPQAPEWQSVLEKIKAQVSWGSFNSFFRGSRAFKRDDQFIVQVESSFHKRHMQQHAKLIRSILEPLLPASMDIFIATAEELAPAKVSA